MGRNMVTKWERETDRLEATGARGGRRTTVLFWVLASSFLGLKGLVAPLGAGASSGISGAFADIGIGLRPSALGGAYVAITEGEDAPRWNPARLAYVDYPALTASWKRQFNLVNYYYLSLVFPTRHWGGWGAYLLTSSDGIYSEHMVALAWGGRADSLGLPIPVSLGLAVKLLNTSFGKEGTGEDRMEGSAWGWSVDGAAYGKLGDHFSYGLLLREGVSRLKWESQPFNRSSPKMTYSEELPRNLTLGLGLSVGKGVVGLAFTPSLYSDVSSRLAVGLEWSLWGIFKPRWGYAQNLKGEEVNRWITVGLGIEPSGGMGHLLRMWRFGYSHLFHRIDYSPSVGLSVGW